MAYSTITSKGQTTIPNEIRRALNLRPGDRLEYAVEQDHFKVRVAAGAASLKGALRSNRGKGMSFDQIRKAAARDAVRKANRR